MGGSAVSNGDRREAPSTLSRTFEVQGQCEQTVVTIKSYVKPDLIAKKKEEETENQLKRNLDNPKQIGHPNQCF